MKKKSFIGKPLIRWPKKVDHYNIAIASRLAELLFVHMLRNYALLNPNKSPGWLKGAADQRIAKAMSALHDNPGHKWTVEKLAKTAGISRSAFATRFQSLMGQAPLHYLTQWRMHLATVRLANGEKSLALLAQDLGYSSSQAFSFAFKKSLGLSPDSYRKNHKQKELTHHQ